MNVNPDERVDENKKTKLLVSIYQTQKNSLLRIKKASLPTHCRHTHNRFWKKCYVTSRSSDKAFFI